MQERNDDLKNRNINLELKTFSGTEPAKQTKINKYLH